MNKTNFNKFIKSLTKKIDILTKSNNDAFALLCDFDFDEDTIRDILKSTVEFYPDFMWKNFVENQLSNNSEFFKKFNGNYNDFISSDKKQLIQEISSDERTKSELLIYLIAFINRVEKYIKTEYNKINDEITQFKKEKIIEKLKKERNGIKNLLEGKIIPENLECNGLTITSNEIEYSKMYVIQPYLYDIKNALIYHLLSSNDKELQYIYSYDKGRRTFAVRTNNMLDFIAVHLPKEIPEKILELLDGIPDEREVFLGKDRYGEKDKNTIPLFLFPLNDEKRKRLSRIFYGSRTIQNRISKSSFLKSSEALKRISEIRNEIKNSSNYQINYQEVTKKILELYKEIEISYDRSENFEELESAIISVNLIKSKIIKDNNHSVTNERIKELDDFNLFLLKRAFNKDKTNVALYYEEEKNKLIVFFNTYPKSIYVTIDNKDKNEMEKVFECTIKEAENGWWDPDFKPDFVKNKSTIKKEESNYEYHPIIQLLQSLLDILEAVQRIDEEENEDRKKDITEMLQTACDAKNSKDLFDLATKIKNLEQQNELEASRLNGMLKILAPYFNNELKALLDSKILSEEATRLLEVINIEKIV